MKGVLHRLPDQVAHQFHQRHLLQVLRQFPYWYQPLGRFYQHLSPSRIIVFGYVTLWQAIQVRSLLLNMWEHRLEVAVGLHQENLFYYISFVLPHDPQVYRLHLKCQNTQQGLYRPTKKTYPRNQPVLAKILSVEYVPLPEVHQLRLHRTQEWY